MQEKQVQPQKKRQPRKKAKTEQLTVKIINKSSHPLPSYETAGAAGADIRCWLHGKQKTIAPMERLLIPTGLFIELPEGYEAQIRPRSGVSFRKGLSLSNCVGTIDSDYRGEVKLTIINLDKRPQTIKCGDRLAQLLVKKVEQATFIEVDDVSETKRGDGGFGSTGV